jgi:hypothetical protein
MTTEHNMSATEFNELLQARHNAVLVVAPRLGVCSALWCQGWRSRTRSSEHEHGSRFLDQASPPTRPGGHYKQPAEAVGEYDEKANEKD